MRAACGRSAVFFRFSAVLMSPSRRSAGYSVCPAHITRSKEKYHDSGHLIGNRRFPLDLAILNEIFKHLFQVECFEEARPAMSYVRRNSQRVCAVLLDICLGRRGAGFQVLQQLQSAPETTPIPVILITADAQEEYVLNGLKKGAADFLVKPVNPHTVQERVCAAVRSAWPAGTTVLDTEKPDSPPHPAEAERCLPDLASRWERLLQLFFQSRPQLHPPAISF